MDAFVAIEFALLWLIVTYLLARAIAAPVFSGVQRELVPAAMAFALVVGAALPYHWIESGARAAASLTALSAPNSDDNSSDESAACERASSEEPSSAAALGSLDGVATANGSVAPGSAVSRTAQVRVFGWAALPTRMLGTAACVRVDGRAERAAVERYGLSRPDVAKVLGAPKLERAGFSIELPAAALAPGVHRFAIVLVSSDGRLYGVPGDRELTIR